MNIAWLTDIHLNFLTDDQKQKFYSEITRANVDALLISGDIAEADCLEDTLIELAEAVKKPIYFVLGNHDYYGSSVDALRKEMIKLNKESPLLKWIPNEGVIKLSEDTILVGQDGWADARYGNIKQSRVVMNDSTHIEDLVIASQDSREKLVAKMQELADRDAALLKSSLKEAITKKPKRIIVLTHVPPFKEACMYRGQPTDDAHLPFFASKASGDVLKLFADYNRDIDFTVLSGHTHHPGFCEPAVNMQVRAGKTEYGSPGVQDIIILKSPELAMSSKSK